MGLGLVGAVVAILLYHRCKFQSFQTPFLFWSWRDQCLEFCWSMNPLIGGPYSSSIPFFFSFLLILKVVLRVYF